MAEFTNILMIGLWLICTILAIGGCLYLVFAATLVRKFTGGPALPLKATPSITILKPLCGAEPDLETNLASFCVQSYPEPVQLVFGVSDAADPAAAVVRRLMERFPDLDIELVADARAHGANLKLSNIINMMSKCRHDVIILSDSDIRVDHAYLRRIAGALAAPGVGLVTCLYRGLPGAGLWSQLSAMSIDQHFLPNVLVGLKLGLAQPCFGSTIALRAETLSQIGGFERFSDQLADDYAIGDAVRRLGLAVAIPPVIIGHACSERTFGDLIRHELRWARTICLINPTGHAGSLVTHPLPFAIAAAALQGFSLTGLGMIALVLACRLLPPIQINHKYRQGGASLWLTPVRDLLSFAIFLASFLPWPVTWRGQRFAVRSDGTLTPIGG